MPRNITRFADPNCFADSLSQVGVWDAPVRKPCGAHGFYADPCQAWNRLAHCAFDQQYFEPVCVGAGTPPVPPCVNELVLTFGPLAAGVFMIGGGIRIRDLLNGGTCFNSDQALEVQGPLTADQVAQAYGAGFDQFGGLGYVEGNKWIVAGGLRMADCCALGENIEIELNEINIPLVSSELICCAAPPPGPSPCTEQGLAIIFPDIPSGQVVSWLGFTLGNAQSICLQADWNTETLNGPMSGATLASKFAAYLPAINGTAVGNRYEINLAESGCCITPKPLAATINWFGLYPLNVEVEDCCDYDPTPPGGCPEGLTAMQARWTFIMFDRPGIPWGTRTANGTCGLANDGGAQDSVWGIYGLTLGGCAPTVSRWLSNRTSCHLSTGCAANFNDFVTRSLTSFGSVSVYGCIPNNILNQPGMRLAISSSPVVGFLDPVTNLPTAAVEVSLLFDLNVLKAQYGEGICDTGFCNVMSLNRPNQSAFPTVGFVEIENLACCGPLPPPEPPDPPGFCEHTCPPPPRRICDNPPDLLRFHFQMPDDLNNWPNTATAGWTQTGSPWLATVWAHSEDCCTPPWELMAEDYVVGIFNDGKQTLQNIQLNPEFLPARFYLQFVFNNARNETISLYTDYYERMCCPEETVFIEWEYTDLDCEGQFHGEPEKWFGTSALAYQPAMRIHGALMKTGYAIEREEENNRTRRVVTRAQYRLRTAWLPPYMISRLRLALGAAKLFMNGDEVQFSGTLARAVLTGEGGTITLDLEGPECVIGNNC